MNIKLSGLTWRVHSPSHFELVHSVTAHSVHLFFTGNAWAVGYRFPSGQTFHRMFRTRDDAMTVLSLARECA